MYDTILVRYGEIALKGQNRYKFINRLIQNIRWSLDELGSYELEKSPGRIFIHPDNKSEMMLERLKMIPGIVSLSPTITCPLDFEELKEKALRLFEKEVDNYPTTFKVETKRANKNFPYQSPQVSRDLGAYILENINKIDNRLTVDVHEPDHLLNIEIRREKIYIFTRVIHGPGGLPYKSSGKGLLLLSGGIDSPVAGWLGMKRGIELEAVYFHSFPYTSDRAKEKVIDLSRILSKYGGKIKLYVNYFTEIQKAIQAHCPSKYNITIMRRMMFRVAAKIARQNNDLVLITGESVGQVASQTLESMNAINAVTEIPILRPLITMDKTEIMKIARKIGTYETSILPYEDCCTIFVPKHPETKPTTSRAVKAEENLDIDNLIRESIEKTEILTIRN